jgi:hypothetical protein
MAEVSVIGPGDGELIANGPTNRQPNTHRDSPLAANTIAAVASIAFAVVGGGPDDRVERSADHRGDLGGSGHLSRIVTAYMLATASIPVCSPGCPVVPGRR